jgi:hypothetical protein
VPRRNRHKRTESGVEAHLGGIRGNVVLDDGLLDIWEEAGMRDNEPNDISDGGYLPRKGDGFAGHEEEEDAERLDGQRGASHVGRRFVISGRYARVRRLRS